MNKLSQQRIKERLGEKASHFINSGMKVGLGSGSTAHCFIESLAKRCAQENLKITTSASSKESAILARNLGLPVLEIDQIGRLDITIDGADEVDTQKRLIKGAGGAHVREKIIAAASLELLIIIDETKLVEKLGKKTLPVEILPFGKETTKKHLEHLGFFGQWRKIHEDLFITENGNHLLDVKLEKSFDDPEICDKEIRSIPGVVDTGFFFHLTGRVLIGFSDGQLLIKE